METLNDGATLLEQRTKINDNFAESEARFLQNTSDIGLNTLAIAQNASDIAQNAADIANLSGPDVFTVEVTDTSTDVENGTALLASYALAVASAPTAIKRATVILPPATYDLGSATLNMDTSYVDVIGLVQAPVTVVAFPGATPVGKPVAIIKTTGDNAVNMTGSLDALLAYVQVDLGEIKTGENSGSAGNTLLHIYCDDGIDLIHSYATCLHCWVGDQSFSTSTPAGMGAHGHYYACVAPALSFAADGNATGVFTHCVGGDYSFGSAEDASGTFSHCVGGFGSFGGFFASGDFFHCTGGDSCFGAFGNATGTFEYCTALGYSFGYGDAAGVFRNCVGGIHAFGDHDANGTFYYCTAGADSFGGLSGGAGLGVFHYCVGGNNSFGVGATKYYCTTL